MFSRSGKKALVVRKIIACIFTLLCMLGSSFASDKPSKTEQALRSQPDRVCEKTTEAQSIARFADKVSRRGNELILHMENGAKLIQKSADLPPGEWPGHRDCDGKTNVSYVFYDFVDPWYLILEFYYEDSELLLVNRKTGFITGVECRLDGSPDHTRFLELGSGEGDDGVECLRLAHDGLVEEWVLEHGRAYDFEWLGSSVINVTEGGSRNLNSRVVAQLKLEKNAWSCLGSPQVCEKLILTNRIVRGNGKRPAHAESPKTGTKKPATTKVRNKDAGNNLTKAAEEGDLKQVRRYLRQGVPIDTVDANGWTALEKAAGAGQIETMKFLLNKGAKVNPKPGFTPPLMPAVWKNQLESAKLLLEHGADVNIPGPYGRTPLMTATWAFYPDMVELLLNHGADPNMRDSSGYTALNGPGFSLPRHSERDPIPHSSKPELVKGADPNIADCRGATALLKVLGIPLLVKQLLEGGADVNAEGTGVSGRIALHEAAFRGYLETVRILLDNGADINKVNQEGSTALISAAVTGHAEVIQLLLERGADVNAKDRQGQSALMTAARYGYRETAKLLVAAGADINAADQFGWTALTWAADQNRPEIGKHLKDQGAHVTLTAAACFGDIQTVERLIKEGVDVNAQGANGHTALMGAAERGHLNVMKLLLDAGADINARHEYCWTALDCAKHAGREEALKLLKAHGATEE